MIPKPTEESIMTGAGIVANAGNAVPGMSGAEIGLSHAGNWLAAIIENSFDAILSKTLDGIITSWNAGAERLFGYAAKEAIGQPITIIIPDDKLSEETDIITRLRRGERIDRFESVRRKKGGELIEVELTISPVRDEDGEIIGASKIARNISERRRQAEAQALLLREMSHRIKNLLSIIQALVRFGDRGSTVEQFQEDLHNRLAALARAHDLILHGPQMADAAGGATLDKLLREVLSPYFSGDRIAMDVPPVVLGRHAVTSLALIFHELATNAVKYGGLSGQVGRLRIFGEEREDRLLLFWREEGGQTPGDRQEGFGTSLVRAALQNLRGSIEQNWRKGGLELELHLSADKLAI